MVKLYFSEKKAIVSSALHSAKRNTYLFKDYSMQGSSPMLVYFASSSGVVRGVLAKEMTIGDQIGMGVHCKLDKAMAMLDNWENVLFLSSI